MISLCNVVFLVPKFDDSRTSEINESSVITNAAYVLFYRRRCTK